MSSTDPAQFPNFESDPTAPLLDNFRRLAIQEGWRKKTNTYKEQKRSFLAAAVVDGFLDYFGGDAKSLQAWQSLCQTIGVPKRKEGEEAPLLTSINKCQKALKGVYVNIVDLVDAGSAGKVISKTFSSPNELAKYIRRSGKVFPKDQAKANPLLARFLIVVTGRSGRKSGRKPRRATESNGA